MYLWRSFLTLIVKVFGGTPSLPLSPLQEKLLCLGPLHLCMGFPREHNGALFSGFQTSWKCHHVLPFALSLHAAFLRFNHADA